MTKFRKILDERGITITDFSRQLGFTGVGYLNKFFYGTSSLYKAQFKTVKQIADALNVDMLDLIEEEDLEDNNGSLSRQKRLWTNFNKCESQSVNDDSVLYGFGLDEEGYYISLSVVYDDNEGGRNSDQYEGYLDNDKKLVFMKNKNPITQSEFAKVGNKILKLINRKDEKSEKDENPKQ